MSNRILINPEIFPAICKAFQELDLAAGAVNRYEPMRTSYLMPAGFSGSLVDCEAVLATLTADELSRFCDGDYDENQEWIWSRPELRPAYDLLEAYFNGEKRRRTSMVKRVTAAIYDNYLHALDLHQVLTKVGIDSVLIRKYAVQVHPDQVERAKDALRVEEIKRKAASGI